MRFAFCCELSFRPLDSPLQDSLVMFVLTLVTLELSVYLPSAARFNFVKR